MAFRTNLPNFSKGELGPELIARVDVEAYASGVRRARNVFIRKYGGLCKRPGTRFVAEVYDASKPVRLIPFQFSIEQAYALEMGQGYMRAGALGGLVLNEELAVSAITNATYAQVTAALHAYLPGDQVYFKGVNGMDEIDGLTGKVVAVIDANNFTVDINTTGFGVFTSALGGIVRTEPPVDPTPDPVVPPVVPPPPPPHVGGGGGCPADDEMWLLANDTRDGPGIEMMGRDLDMARDWVWTQHAKTGVWGAYRIAALAYVDMDVMYAAGLPQALPDIPARGMRATGDHPMRKPGIEHPWFRMDTVGRPVGRARIVKAMVADAHTMIVNGVLSHNFKSTSPDLP